MQYEIELNQAAEQYVKLALALGEHEEGYVDAYYGDPGWPELVKAEKKTLNDIEQEAKALVQTIHHIDLGSASEILQLRQEFLLKQTSSITARARMNAGEKLTFDQEAEALYDTVPPHFDEQHFKNLVQRLDAVLPGEGDLTEQFHAFQQQFIIAKDKLDVVFQAAIQEARNRTKQHATLQHDEEFRLEYVTDKIWSGYNWYQGKNHSLIQINTDFPIFIDRAVDLAAHEGYPGHHVYNSLLDNELYRKRGWVEFSIYPLFSPQSVIAEGTANYGIEVVFPEKERVEFEKQVLFPLAGFDPGLTEKYYQVQALLHDLNYVNNEVARLYFADQIDKQEALRWLRDYLLYEPERAEQRLKFIEANRAYVMTYNWGQDLVKAYVESQMTAASSENRWQVFIKLLSSPRLPSGLQIN